MSFDDLEASRDRGAPVVLILFVYGSTPNAFYAYTTAEQEITFNGIPYTPIPVKTGDIISSGDLDKSTMEIDTPQDSDVARLFLVYPPSQEVSVIIHAGHANDPAHQFGVVWTGRVLSCARDEGQAKLTCEPVQTSLRRSGLRAFYSHGCRHALYGPRCMAQMAPRTYARQVIGLTGNTIELASGWWPNEPGIDPESFIGGMIRWIATAGPEYRTILRVGGVNSSTLSIAGFMRELRVGDTIDVIAGCAHDLNDCEHLHANVPNYGGFPWIPYKNPVGTNPYI